MQKSVEDILRDVADKHGVSFEMVRSIWINQWRYTAFRFRCGKRGDYDSFRFVYLPGLMRFYTAREKVAILQEIADHTEKCKQEGIRKWKEKKILKGKDDNNGNK